MDWINELKFDERGLIPCVTQDAQNGEVLMQAYMSKASIKRTVETGKACYFSRSRNQLWLKGETSGNYQIIRKIATDCDGDALLLQVEQVGTGACHTGARSCFFTTRYQTQEQGENPAALLTLYDTVADRKKNPASGSYTTYLFEQGTDKILKKVGEESAEVLIATKNKIKDEIIYETADLLYHLTVNLVNENLCWGDIFKALDKRRK